MSYPKTTNKEMNKLLKSAYKKGWKINRGKSHIKCYSPDGKKIVVVSQSPTDHRAVENAKQDFRKLGIKSKIH